MKITFIYADYASGTNRKKFNIGIAILSSILKQNGFKTDLIHLYDDIGKEKFIDRLKSCNTDILIFSYNSNSFYHIKKYIEWADIIDIPKIHGGIHPTIAPEECISLKSINIICRGEGDQALPEFCKAIRDKKDYKHIKNLWIKTGNKIIKNPIRSLIENLDSLPFLDYDIFNYKELSDYVNFKRLVFMASRGCPYQCTYCCNHLLKKLYPNQNKYVRFKSVDRFINEIKTGLKKFPDIQEIRFFDDTLTLHKNYFREFAAKYKKEIGMPYSCNDRANQIDEEVAHLLKESGCYSIDIGIENGNENMRRTVLKRYMTNEQIINAFKLLKQVGITTSSFNIIGVPGETMSTFFNTIRLNALVKPAHYINAYFNAFQGTDLYAFCKKNKLTIHEVGGSLFEKPTVTIKNFTENQIIFGFKYFTVLVKLYKILYKLPNNFFKSFDKFFEKLISSKFFPYRFFNIIYIFDITTITKILKKVPFLYNFIHFIRRKLYRKK